MGLAWSRRLAQALGGDAVLLDGQAGLGSIFSFTISTGLAAIQRGQPGRDELGSSVTERGFLKWLRILVAEDSADSQEIVRRILLRGGADVQDVQLVDNGLDALELAVHGDYDIVIMDLQMPILSGLAASKALRDRGYSKPILALTAHAREEECRRSALYGCSVHLAKPVDALELCRTIARLAGRWAG